MLVSILLLLLFQVVGQAAVAALGLPLPGPVLGMAALLALLAARPGLTARAAPAADGLLAHLGLLFVPAGVGVMLHLGLLAREWLPIVAALVVSTFLGMIVTGLVFDRLLRRAGQAEARDADRAEARDAGRAEARDD